MTKFNLQEFKTLEKIKLSYLKHRGNILAVLEDLGWDANEEKVTYVKKAIKKIKGKENRDVDVLISNTLMQQMLVGYESRTHHLMEVMKALEGRHRDKLSVCCEAPVKPNDKQEGRFECLACGKKEAAVMVVDNEGMIDLKLATIESLREEDAAMVEFATKMGYTNIPPEQKQPTIKQNIIVMPGGKDQDPAVISDLQNVSPLTRDILVDKLQKQIMTIDIEASAQDTPKDEA